MEVTEALKFPNVTFVGTDVTMDGSEFKAAGTLTFHGIAQQVVLQGKLLREGTKLTFTGEFKLKMTAFKIDPPSLMGISTDDEFKLRQKRHGGRPQGLCRPDGAGEWGGAGGCKDFAPDGA